MSIIRVILFIYIIFSNEKLTFSKDKSCTGGPIYENVTLEYGLNSGTYKEVGHVNGGMKECQEKCCQDSTCHISFMLGSNCYTLSCQANKYSCKMKRIQNNSSINPQLSYIVRVKEDNIRNTLFAPEELPSWNGNKCAPMKAIHNFTLVDGIQAGHYTDMGHVDDLNECYEHCCNQPTCNVALKVMDNCFTVVCKSINGCKLKEAKFFGPLSSSIAYIYGRKINSFDFTIPATTIENKTIPVVTNYMRNFNKNYTDDKQELINKVMNHFNCPITSTFSGMTLKGGKEAGYYHDSGFVKDFEECKQLCCHNSTCHISLLIGKHRCFLVSCKSVELCLLKQINTPQSIEYLTQISIIRSISVETHNIFNSIKNNSSGNHSNEGISTKPSKVEIRDTNQIKNVSNLPNGLIEKDLKNCTPLKVFHNYTLVNGRKSGLFNMISTNYTSEQCYDYCCQHDKCNISVLLNQKCFTLECSSKESCTLSESDSTKTAQIMLVKLQELPNILKNDVENTTYVQCNTLNLLKDHVLVGISNGVEWSPDVRRKLIKSAQNPTECAQHCCSKNIELESKKDKDHLFCDSALWEKDKCFEIQCLEDIEMCFPTKSDWPNASIIWIPTHVEKHMNKTINIDNKKEHVHKSNNKINEGTFLDESQHNFQSSCGNYEIIFNVTIPTKDHEQINEDSDFIKKISDNVTTMEDCLKLCCQRSDIEKCDVAYLSGGKCLSINCMTQDACRPVPLTNDEVQSQMAFIKRSSTYFLKKKKETLLVYTLFGTIIAIFIIISTVWLVFRLKRNKKRLKSKRRRRFNGNREKLVDNP